MSCPTGNKQYLTEVEIRLWLRDTDPEANLLLNDFEFTSEEIRAAMSLTVDVWNDTPPYINNFDLGNFPFRSALLKGTCANLLFIAANRYRRNDLNYEISGGAVNDQNKWQTYDAAGERMWTEFRQWVAHNKRAMNMEAGFAVIDGGMSFIR